MQLLFENTELMEARHPVFRVPCAHDLAVSELVDVDRLDAHPALLWCESHESISLRTRDLGADDYLVTGLQHLVDPDRQVRECRSELEEDLLRSLRSRRLCGSGWNVDPTFTQDPLEEGWVSPIECLVPERHIVHRITPFLSKG